MTSFVEALAGARTLQAFKSRDFRLVWAGQTVSLIGNAAFLVAVGWKTLEITGARRIATEAGLDYVEDACTAIVHRLQVAQSEL